MRPEHYASASTEGLPREAVRLIEVIPLIRVEGKSTRNIQSVEDKLALVMAELRRRDETGHVLVSAADAAAQLLGKFRRSDGR